MKSIKLCELENSTELNKNVISHVCENDLSDGHYCWTELLYDGDEKIIEGKKLTAYGLNVLKNHEFHSIFSITQLDGNVYLIKGFGEDKNENEY